MEQVKKEHPSIQHLAGIVPIAGPPLEFKMPWHDSMMPIGPDFLAVERAVYQCAMAGCETIWIVGHLGTQPLLRKRIGDMIIDPLVLDIVPSHAFKKLKEISIYYVPIHPKDRDKRDTLGWSVLYGADSAFRIAKHISKWIAPEKFFCSFPYGIVSDDILHTNRLLISSKKGNVSFAHQAKTVKDNLHLPFTFDANDYFKCRDIVKHKLAEDWGNKGEFGARYYDLKAVFNGLDDSNRTIIDTEWFHDISTWQGYRDYMASPQFGIYKKLKTIFKKPYRKKLYGNSEEQV